MYKMLKNIYIFCTLECHPAFHAKIGAYLTIGLWEAITKITIPKERLLHREVVYFFSFFF